MVGGRVVALVDGMAALQVVSQVVGSKAMGSWVA